MRLITRKQVYCVATETEAKEATETLRKQADEKGHIVEQLGYVRKTKKAKGVVIDERFLITLITTHDVIWEEEV